MVLEGPLVKVASALAVVSIGFGVYQMSVPQPSVQQHRAHVLTASRHAVIVGATGATGQHVLRQLLDNDRWSSVLTIGRSAIASHPKLTSITLSDLGDEAMVRSAWTDTQTGSVLFNCIGTTRGQAGSATQFKAVEVGITAAVTSVASERGVSHVVVVSAQGANPNQWAVDWIHPLLYVRTLGEKEEASLSPEGSILRRTIFRPGMLNRLKEDRWVEIMINRLGIGLRVDRLAMAMIRVAESDEPTEREDPVVFQGNAAIEAGATRL